jgi:sugar lactone lactonase YvrE
MQRLHLYLLILVFSFGGTSSAQVPLGSWREHLPYLHGAIVVPAKGRIFCAGDESLFAQRTDDNSIERFSKLNGLNDFGISAMAYASDYHYLMVAYNNSNIDLIGDDNTITNFSDVKRKNIPGDKTIYSFYISGRYAYLACGFGIVVFDMQKKEIKDTYYIGTNGSNVVVYEVTEDAQYIYAATADAVYRADINNPNLADFNNWTNILDDGGNAQNTYNHILHFGNAIIVNQSRATGGDSLMTYNGTWSGNSSLMNFIGYGTIKAMYAEGTTLYAVNATSVSIFDASYNRTRIIDGNNFSNPQLRDARIDANGIVWAADHLKGLVRIDNTNAVTNAFPKGPNNAQTSNMECVNGKLRVMHGPRTRGWENQYYLNGYSTYLNGEWTTMDGYSTVSTPINQYGFFDAMNVATDPFDPDHFFIGSAGKGLLEMHGDQTLGDHVVKFYLDTNSTLKQMVGNAPQVKVHGMQFDQDGNLWMSNAGVATVLNVLKRNGTWKAFNLTGKINSSSKTGDVIVDNYGYIWTIVYENIGGKDGVLMYNTNGTLDDVSDDQYDIADLSSIRVRCIAQDKDGLIWAGTEKGIYVFYPPSVVPQQILIRQDNTYQYLLESDVVTAIAVDAANRKWIGTEAGGLYLFSADGLTQISHYTKDNSPLFSDNISALCIDGSNGEVYIGTEKGLLSFRSDAVEGETGCSGILVYPSPVTHAYDGPIAIKGLVSNGIVKITDITGKIVFETRSLGSQAIWDGRNFEGERVSTGVYLVLAADKNGDNTCVTKLMVTH